MSEKLGACPPSAFGRDYLRGRMSAPEPPQRPGSTNRLPRMQAARRPKRPIRQ